MERITEYFSRLLELTNEDGWVIHEDLTFREIDDKEGYIKGSLYLNGGFKLHIAEYVVITDKKPTREKYRYQLLNAQDEFLSRWDNAPHHTEVSTHPHHRHCKNGKIEPSPAMSIHKILSRLEPFLKDDF